MPLPPTYHPPLPIALPHPLQTHSSLGAGPLPARSISSPSQRPNGDLSPYLVTTSFSQDSIATYRGPQTPQASTASESVDVKSPSGMEHGDYQGSWSMNHDHRANGSISNGPSHSNDPAYHPPPPPQGQYPQFIPYPKVQYSDRAKQVRARRACDNCRSKKQKCDEQQPCQSCRDDNLNCQYQPVRRPR